MSETETSTAFSSETGAISQTGPSEGEATEERSSEERLGDTEERLTVPPAPAQPHVIHNVTRRNDHDALTGHAVEIEDGEHQGKRGIFEKVDSYERDGYPKTVIVSLDNVTGFVVSLPYKSIRHIPPGEIRNG